MPTYGIVLDLHHHGGDAGAAPAGHHGARAPFRRAHSRARSAEPRGADAAQFGPAQIALAVALLLYPAVASEFFLTQIGAYSLIWGLLALSMMLLAGYGGMVSLAQISDAGVAAYTVAIFGTNNMNISRLRLAVVGARSFRRAAWRGCVSAVIGAISVRTEGIYTIMITLAIAAAFFYFAQQNYALFNGHSGYAGIPAPQLLGHQLARSGAVLLSLPVRRGRRLCGGALLLALDFGLAVQAIRDNGRRMRAVGFDITAHKVVAYFYSGVIAGLAGVLLVWFNGRVSPGTVNVAAGDRRSGHRGDRRAAPSDRPVPRRRRSSC